MEGALRAHLAPTSDELSWGEVCAHLIGSSSFRGHPLPHAGSPRSEMLRDLGQRIQTPDVTVSFSFLCGFSQNDLSDP